MGRRPDTTPRNPSVVSIAAWTSLDDVDEDVVGGSDREYGNRNALEPGAICPFQVDQGI